MTAIPRRLDTWYKSHVSYLTVTPILVTWAIIIASIIIGMVSARNVASVQSQAVDKQLRENALLVHNAFNAYEQLVWSGVGRMDSAPVDRASWQTFVATYQQHDKFSAISRLGVTRLVTPDTREQQLAQLSEEYGQPISISNESPDGISNIIAYSSPESQTTINNIGYNVWDDANRRQTTERATDTDDVAMTDQIKLLVNAKSQEKRTGPGFIIYAPYYVPGAVLDTPAQRRAAVQGHVFASFQTDAAFKQILSRLDPQHIEVTVTVHDVGNSGPVTVYRSPAQISTRATLARHQDVTIYGQTFGFDYKFDRSYLVSTTQLNAPLYTALFGSLVGLLVGTVTFFFLRGRYHQVLLDKEREVARAKDELLSLASHQLRTPATGVKQYLGMVTQGFVGPISTAQAEMLAKAYKSNERQLRVINDILHLAKLDMGRIVLAKTKFDLAELVNDVIDEQHQEITQGELTVRTKIIKTAPIYADMHMLRMVVENLLNNAVKYTGPGGTITVRLERKNGEYHLMIRDTGVGINERDMPLLFKQFSRIRNARSHLVTGTGVGLYLAKHLVQLHGGDIIVESQEGVGSSFIVLLPRNDKSV